MKKKLYLVYLDNIETQGMFDENGELITWWHCNDALWSEGFKRLEHYLNIEVIYTTDVAMSEKLWIAAA